MGIKLIVGAALAGVLNTLWVGLAIAALAWALGRYLPRTNAATRHLLGWAALALVLLVPFAALEREPVRDVDSVTTAAVVKAPSVASTNAPDAAAPLAAPRAIFPLQLHEGDWLAVALGLWMAFGFLQTCRIALSFVYLRKLKRDSHAAPDVLLDRFQYWVTACGIRRPVRLLVSERIQSPMATGFRHPAVIVPSNLFAHFDAGELDHVLLHELAHVARRDDWSNLFARCLSAVVGLHPVAAWILRQIARERELACDDWVVSRIGEARPYAASLARLFEVCRGQRRVGLATGMAGRASQLGERIETLLASGRQFSARVSFIRVGITTLALLALVAAGAHAPHWIALAQSPATTTPAPPGDAPRPVNPRGSFLAALVAAGYGNLSVDEIIGLKDHGIDARFLADFSQSGWEKMAARDLIEMHDHGVPAEMLRALRDAGFQHLEIDKVVNAYEQGVRPGTLKEATQYGTHLTLPQIVKLKQAGVIQ
jgi:beta-lactamase regulating signal transducer with metallopeptidase domain